MLSQNNNALGIIFPNSYDNTVPELVTERAMASIPFACLSWCARTTTP